MTFARKRLRGAETAMVFVIVTTIISSLIGILSAGFSRVFLDELLSGKSPSWFIPFLIGLGLLISVLSADLNQAMMGAFIVSVPLVMLSGLATPVESMPDFFQYITLANPMRYGIEALRRIFLEGAVPSDLPHAFLILTAIGIVSSLLAYLIFQYQRKA